MSLKESLVNNAVVRLIVRILRHFDTVPAGIRQEYYRFYIISNIAYTVAWIIHTDWFFAFLYLGQYTMMWIQLVSVGCHVLAINLNRRGYHLPAMMIGMMEVIGHQFLAVYLLGWDTGFQYIIPAIALFPFLKHDGSIVVKSLLVLCCMFSFLYLEIFMQNKVPVFIMSRAAVHGFNYFNIVCCFIFIATWGIFITIAIHRSEEILIRRNMQLANEKKIR